jgi:hypothetical protein
MGSVDLDNYKYNMTANRQAPFEIMMHAIPHLKEQKTRTPNRQCEFCQRQTSLAALPRIV